MNCKLIGSYVKHLEVELMQNEEFYVEKGAVIYFDSAIDMNLRLSGNGLGGLIGAKLSGESLVLIQFRNPTYEPRKLVVGSRVGIQHFKLSAGELICRRGAYIASNRKVDVSIKLSISGWLGGMGAILQRVSGDSDTTVFIQTTGDPVIADLAPGQSIRVDEDHFLATQGIPESRISAKWSPRSLIGGEGWSMLTVTGPGRIYLNPSASKAFI